MRERARSTPKDPEKQSRDVQLADNRRAFYDYTIEEKLEAGLSLTGTEIKSLRAGHVNMRNGFARVEDRGQVDPVVPLEDQVPVPGDRRDVPCRAGQVSECLAECIREETVCFH